MSHGTFDSSHNLSFSKTSSSDPILFANSKNTQYKGCKVSSHSLSNPSSPDELKADTSDTHKNSIFVNEKSTGTQSNKFNDFTSSHSLRDDSSLDEVKGDSHDTRNRGDTSTDKSILSRHCLCN